MPIQRCTLPGGGQGWKWGSSGKCYPTRAGAEKQAQAAYASGYREKNVTVSQVHVGTALGNQNKKPKREPQITSEPFEITVDVDKRNDDMQVVYGWASVTHEANEILTDLQGDQIDIEDLSKAAHEFMLAHRVAGIMHEALGVGTVVESVVFTRDLQAALGVDLGKVGWFIGMHVIDEDVWKRVKDGELRAFSIGGRAQREMIKVAPREFFLIRHGHTSMNHHTDQSADRIRAWKDIPLDEEGRKDAYAMATALIGSGIECLYCSDLSRAKDTAKIIGEAIGSEVEPLKELRPWDLGKFAGRTTVDALPEIAIYASQTPDEKVPGGESFNDFKARAFEGLRKSLAEDRSDVVGIVTHHRFERLIEAWKAAGFPEDHSLDVGTFLDRGCAPGSVIKMEVPI